MESTNVLLSLGYKPFDKCKFTGKQRYKLDYHVHNNIQCNDECIYYVVVHNTCLTLNKVTETSYGNTNDTFQFSVPTEEILKTILTSVL